MALIACPECQKQVSSSAVMCLTCGYPIGNGGREPPSGATKVGKSFGVLPKILMALAVVVGCVLFLGAIQKPKSPSEIEKLSRKEMIQACYNDAEQQITLAAQSRAKGPCQRMEGDYIDKYKERP